MKKISLRQKKKNTAERLKVSFSIKEMDYGSDIRLYKWNELSLSEQLLISSTEHNELKQGYEKQRN